MEFRTASGKIIGDAEFEDMAKDYELGAWTGTGEVTIGRPKLYGEDMETVSFRIPRSRVVAVEAVTERLGISKSDFYRLAVDRELLALA